jgi:hypothetical protein
VIDVVEPALVIVKLEVPLLP